jgi:large subunit ribosomal protein L49
MFPRLRLLSTETVALGQRVGLPEPVLGREQLERVISEKLSSQPFFVERTAFGKGLPVYSDIKNGRTRHLTVVRRIYGDINALTTQLKNEFPEINKISVKPNQQKILIKGDWASEIKIFLTNLGF